MLYFDFSEKGLRQGSFCVSFFNKNVSHVTLYQLTKFHYLIAFTSRDIGQNVYRNCLLTRLLRHKLGDEPYLPNQVVLLHDRKVKTKI